MPHADPTWRERLRTDGMRAVYHAVLDLEDGEDPVPLLDEARGTPWMRELAARAVTVSVAARTTPCEPDDVPLRETLWALYAAARVRDVLLLPHQPPPVDVIVGPDGEDDRRGPVHRPVPVATTVDFFAAMGCRPVVETGFQPALHEIVSCSAADDPDAPVEVVEVVWPALLVGELVFTRAGVRVRAGRHHAVPGVADRSTLHWEFRRRHRPTDDESFGWGHNSQWRTSLRRDYVTDRGNVYDLDAMSASAERLRRQLPQTQRGPLDEARTELVKNRCTLRGSADPEMDYSLSGIDERRP